MKNRNLKSIRIIAAASLLTMALTATPARADHEQSSGNVIVPIATFVALGLLLNHNRNNRPRYGHYGSYQGGYQGQYHGHKHKNKYKRKHSKYKSRRHSYSQGGYQRPHKRRYQH